MVDRGAGGDEAAAGVGGFDREAAGISGRGGDDPGQGETLVRHLSRQKSGEKSEDKERAEQERVLQWVDGICAK